LQQMVVSETMDREAPVLPAGIPVRELAERIARHEPEVSRHQGMLLMDADKRLAGIITRGDILRSLDEDPSGAMSLLEAGSRKMIVTHPDETLHEAAAKIRSTWLAIWEGRESWRHGCTGCTRNTCANRDGSSGSSKIAPSQWQYGVGPLREVTYDDSVALLLLAA